MSAPLAPGQLDACLAALDAGTPFRDAFEAALRELPPDDANRWMLLHREGRGAWYPLLRASGGTALFLGNALSGSWVPLANNGFEVTVLEPDPARGRFAEHRAREHTEGRATVVQGALDEELPFQDGVFDLVVVEEGVAGTSGAHFRERLDECRRVGRGELFLTAENRLAYKRSTGKRGDFAVAAPWTWLDHALRPRAGQRTLAGYRARLAGADFEPARAFALYPHARDFTHVVGLDRPEPELPIGPMEKKNKLKLFGKAAGLFPVFTPSFGLAAARRGALPQSTRLDRVLDALAEELGEPRPVAEHWTATRGNSIVILTRGPGATDDPRGRWALHLPLSTKETYELGRHARHLDLLHERFPDFPAPAKLFVGELEGIWMVVERRVEGLGAPQLSGRPECTGRLFADVARDYAKLVTEPPRALDEADLVALVDAKFELVRRFATRPETLERLESTRVEARERLRGEVLPRVFYHADLRSKHVRVRPDGSVVGYLDFGAAEVADLPYFDLLHLIVHERKHERDLPAGRAWSIVRTKDGLRSAERAALDAYAAELELGPNYREAIELAYPVLVAAMAEKNWDYSRPEWLYRQFGF